MSRMISKTILWILVGACLLPFVMDMMLIVHFHKGAVPGFEIKPETFTNGTYTLEPRVLQLDDPLRGVYTMQISGEKIRAINGEGPSLLINRLSCQGGRVFFNGMLIGLIGDPANGSANTWNTAFVFPIDSRLIEGENTLCFELLHEYEAGIEGMVFMTNNHTARRMFGNISLVTGSLSSISIGMAFCGCIMILFMILLNQRRHSHFGFLALSLVSLAIYAFDYIHIPYLPIPYVIYKKIIIVALFLTLAFASVTISKLFHKKLPVVVNFVALGVVLLGTFITRDTVSFKHYYQLCMISIPVMVALWLVVVIPCYKVKEEARIFFFGLMLFLGVSLYDISVLYLFPGFLSRSVFPYTVVYLAIVIMLMNLDIRRKNETIQQESSRRFHFYRKAITDGLTGLFNRDYMISHLEREKPPFAVAMLDIDNFKTVNDDFGHHAGDRMIQFAGKMLSSTLRETDKVGRYGGDEFIVILHSCGPNAYSIMERFRAEIAHNCQAVDNNLLSITFSIGICYILEEESADQILRKADKALYLAKHNGRNMVCMYE